MRPVLHEGFLRQRFWLRRRTLRARYWANKRRNSPAGGPVTKLPHSPALRRQLHHEAIGSSALETVQSALSSLVARYRFDEVLTALRRFPAREAQFRPVPSWVAGELAAVYQAKGIEGR